MAMIIPYNERVERFFHRKNSKAYRIFTLLFTVLLRISFALYTLYSLFFKSGFDRQLSFVIIFAFIVLWPLQKKTTLFSDKGKFRDLYIAAVIMLPLIVYMVAHYKVETIKTGLNSYIVTSDSDCVKVNNERFRYISSIGDKAFAYSLEDGSLCVFKYNYLHLIDENKKIQADLEALNAHTS
ncbi:hypothetical protein UXQ08_09620 [Enterobacter ludwigii]|uniref:hypothetical protein n=1 Tax=Enterobacter ludwigii TaxID=299767 RepID=UPI0010CD2BA3|nr:hypothetical protein [Enterobacter ludwigii]QCR94528.1 hypothetical protein ELJP6_18745 [Enterobacter ludwigii]QCU07430.1 hypothetical protein ELJP9_18730 [Enterobacter ludwigii]